MQRQKKLNVDLPSYKEVRAEILQWLGPKIRNRMRELGISQPDLERITGIGASTISDYLLGRYEPSLSKILLLSQALNVNWSFFFEEDGKIRESKEDLAEEAPA